MLEYSVDKPLTLSLKKPALSKGQYSHVLSEPLVYGQSKSKPRLSVVVVAYNEGQDLIEALLRVYNQSSKIPFEVVLVDNGLDESTKEQLLRFNLTYILTKRNIGCSAGRNVGSLFAKAPAIGFVDADGFIDERFVTNALGSISKYPTAVRGRVLPKTVGSVTPPSYDLGDNTFPYYINAEGISVWNRKKFIAAGGFEDVLYGGEGVTLQNRMIEIYGMSPESFGYDPKIVLKHDYNRDPAHFKEKQTRYEIIARKMHMRYPFMAQMISAYNKQVVDLIPERSPEQRRVTAQIENIRFSVDKEFGEYYRAQYQKRLNNPALVNGTSENPMFSVVIPCYNVGNKLRRAVDSVLIQTIPSLEIIIVDDASTGKETISALAKLRDKVNMIHHNRNQGVATARNTGVSAARAPYILCLDGDDTIEMNYLEEAFNVFEGIEAVGLVSCWARLVGARSGVWQLDDKISIPEALLASPVPTATCFRKDAWRKVGGYDESMRGYEDWNFWISIMKRGFETRVLPKPYFNYTISPVSKVNTSNKNALELVGKIFDNHKELFEKHLRYVVTHKYRDYVVLNTERISLKSQSGERNTILNLFRFKRYPSYARRAFRKMNSFVKLAWDSKNLTYASRVATQKLQLYSKTALRKLGIKTKSV